MKLNIAAFLFSFIFLSAGVQAQQAHFIYIQTSDKQPFYVKLGNNVYSSSVSGYIIISKLLDSTYNFSIGFPKGEWPQQNFTCTVAGNDKGYLLKNFSDKGWGLFNLQTLDVTMAGNKPVENKNTTKEERTDSFSNMLSTVVNDPGIKMTEKKKPEVIADTIQPVATTEAVITKEPEAAAPTVTDKPVVVSSKKTTKKSTIIKLLDKTDADGIQLVYLDIYSGHKDTIRIFIPADKEVAAEQKQEAVIKQEAVAETQPTPPTQPELQVVKQQPKTTDKKFIDMDMPVSNGDTAVKTASKNVVANSDKPPAVATNSGCKNLASEDDFLKLRKKMAEEESDDNMVSAAVKAFKTKCFTTSQIKNLGFLFLNDKGRYSFFNKGYSFVSDPENYSTLVNQLSDPVYIARFKELMNH